MNAAIDGHPKDWYAYQERAKTLHRVADGHELCTSFHWEDQDFDAFLWDIAMDYQRSIEFGCPNFETVENMGDLIVRSYECSNDSKRLNDGLRTLQTLSVTLKVHREKDEVRKVLCAVLTQLSRLLMIGHFFKEGTVAVEKALHYYFQYAPAHLYRAAAHAAVATTEVHRSKILTELVGAGSLDSTIAGIYVLRGGLYAHMGEYTSAIHDLRSAVTVDPTLFPIWFLVGQIYLVQNHDFEECVMACNAALMSASSFRAALYLRAEAQRRAGAMHTALRNYVKLSHTDPVDPFARLLQVSPLLELNEPRKALFAIVMYGSLALRSSVDKSDAEVQELQVLLGKSYNILSDYSKAVAAFNVAVQLNPTTANLCLLSESLHSSGDNESALRTIDRVTSGKVGSLRGYLLRAQCFESMSRFPEAIEQFDKALLMDPTNISVLISQAKMRFKLFMKLRQSSRMLRINAKKGKRFIRLMMNNSARPSAPLSELSDTANNLALEQDLELQQTALKTQINEAFKSCITTYTKCIKIDPSCYDAYVERAQVREMGGHFREAFRDYAKAVKCYPGCTRARIHCGILHSKFQSYTQAIFNYDHALKYDTDSAFGYFNRGVAYHHLGMTYQANLDYSKSIALDGAYMPAFRNRAIVRAKLKNYEGAKEDFEFYLRRFPDDMEVVTALGSILVQLGEDDRAFEFLEASRRNNPLGITALLDIGNMFTSMAQRQIIETPEDEELRKEWLDKAKHAFAKAMHSHPCNLAIRLNLAFTFCVLKDWKNALGVYNDIISISEQRSGKEYLDAKNGEMHAYAYEGRALVYFYMHEHAKTLADLTKAMDVVIKHDPFIRDKYLCFTAKSISRHKFSNVEHPEFST